MLGIVPGDVHAVAGRARPRRTPDQVPGEPSRLSCGWAYRYGRGAIRLRPLMSSESLHEPTELLTEETKNMHRAIVSLVEELEAVDWYNQRAEACTDSELQAVLRHHRDEETEHAMMNLEWIRRHSAVFDGHMRTYLFASGAIVGVEASQKAGEAAAASPASGDAAVGGGGLGVGSLRTEKA
jgi:uncharacterized protein